MVGASNPTVVFLFVVGFAKSKLLSFLVVPKSAVFSLDSFFLFCSFFSGSPFFRIFRRVPHKASSVVEYVNVFGFHHFPPRNERGKLFPSKCEQGKNMAQNEPGREKGEGGDSGDAGEAGDG